MKKIFAFLLAFALVLSMSTTIFAAGGSNAVDPKTAEKELVDPDDLNDTDVLEHTYVAYQIFTGTLSDDGSSLGQIEWGNGVVPGSDGDSDDSVMKTLYTDSFFGSGNENIFAQSLIEIANVTDPGSSTVVPAFTISEDKLPEAARRIAAIIDEFGDYSEAANEFARDVQANLSNKYYSLNSDGSINFGNDAPKPGYYLIKDTYNTHTTEDPEEVANFSLLRVLSADEKIRIVPKVDNPVLTKKVLDINDSQSLSKITDIELTQAEQAACTDDDAIEIKKWEKWFETTGSETIAVDENKTIEDEHDGWKDSADYDIGDHVPFLITLELGRISDFVTYDIQIDDYPCAGLTYDGNAVVKVNGTEKPNLLNQTQDEYGISWVCSFAPMPSNGEAPVLKDRDVITIEYTMTLNDEAVVGSVGNQNEAWATFSNNPSLLYKTAIHNHSTVTDTVRVFTYQAEVNKVDQAGKPLGGAEFELFKKVKLTEAEAAAITEGQNQTTGENVEWKWLSLGEKEAAEVKDENDITTSYTFSWKGIDDGTYKLVETTTPDGYNTAEDMVFTVTAGHDVTADDPQLTAFSVDKTAQFNILAQEYEIYGEEVTSANARLVATITNNKGSTLPETGGIGTKIFYVTGGVLLCAAAVLLVTKKRFDNSAEA